MGQLNAPVPISPGPVITLNGVAITVAAVLSAFMQIGRVKRIRFWVKVLTAPASALTTISVKLQQRYNDGTVQGLPTDLPSNLDDVQGAAQPKGSTFEVTHAFTVAANNTPGVWFSFYVDPNAALHDMLVSVAANAAGIAGDSVIVYAQAA